MYVYVCTCTLTCGRRASDWESARRQVSDATSACTRTHVHVYKHTHAHICVHAPFNVMSIGDCSKPVTLDRLAPNTSGSCFAYVCIHIVHAYTHTHTSRKYIFKYAPYHLVTSCMSGLY